MKLKKIRTDSGLTQQNVAEELDVHQQTVARWENRITEPSIKQLKDLAVLFNTSIDAIVGMPPSRSS